MSAWGGSYRAAARDVIRRDGGDEAGDGELEDGIVAGGGDVAKVEDEVEAGGAHGAGTAAIDGLVVVDDEGVRIAAGRGGLGGCRR